MEPILRDKIRNSLMQNPESYFECGRVGDSISLSYKDVVVIVDNWNKLGYIKALRNADNLPYYTFTLSEKGLRAFGITDL